MTTSNIETPTIVSRAEWLATRKQLLIKEKEFTRKRDHLNTERRRLPMVRIEKGYVFDGPNGKARLLDLFDGRRQLIVYHFIFDPSWNEGCPNCSFFADNIGHLAHLHARDTSLALISRAPLAKIKPFKKRMGWMIPWYSSFGSDFNNDFHVTMDEAVAPVEYNYRDKAELVQKGETYFTEGESHGLSVFLRDGDGIFHTYSTYARGVDLLDGTYNCLDLTPLGRQEGWEEPPGRSNSPFLAWVRHHDRYEDSQKSLSLLLQLRKGSLVSKHRRGEVASSASIGERSERGSRDVSCRVNPLSILAFLNDYRMTTAFSDSQGN